MTHPYHVYGIGNALVDILAQVDDAFLNTVLAHPYPSEAGHTKGSMTLVSTDFQGHLLRLLENQQVRTVSGGSGANTMIGVAHLGGTAGYTGKVGNDVHGTFYADDLHAAGVHYNVPFHHETTGTCIVLVTPDAQRTMFTHLGCSVALTPADVDEAAIKAAQWVYIEGYLWDAPGPRAAAMKMTQIAHQHGVKVACTFSDAFCVRRSLDHLRELARTYVDFVFCNEEEARIFTGAADAGGALRAIRELGCGVAITRGAQGSLISHNDEAHEIPAVRVHAVDTTGAGDLYAAGVLCGLTGGCTVQEAGLRGAQAAAQVIAVHGARLLQSQSTVPDTI